MKILKTVLFLTVVSCQPEQIRNPSQVFPWQGWFCEDAVTGAELDSCSGSTEANVLVVQYTFSMDMDSELGARCQDKAHALIASFDSNRQRNQFISDLYPLASETCTVLNPRPGHSFTVPRVENCVEFIHPSETLCQCAISTTYKGGQIRFEQDLLNKKAPFIIDRC